VTGIDISERGIEQARLLAAETGLERWSPTSCVRAASSTSPRPTRSPRSSTTTPGSGVWRLPEPDDARLPLLLSLKATKA
jgi:hypothetical protein